MTDKCYTNKNVCGISRVNSIRLNRTHVGLIFMMLGLNKFSHELCLLNPCPSRAGCGHPSFYILQLRHLPSQKLQSNLILFQRRTASGKGNTGEIQPLIYAFTFTIEIFFYSERNISRLMENNLQLLRGPKYVIYGFNL